MNPMNIYKSREEAGRVLADLIRALVLKNPYLLAIPRGGIQVAEAIAEELEIPINPIIVKKLPSPNNPEAGFGAIAADGTRVIDEEFIGVLGLDENRINQIAERVMQDIKHRMAVYGEFNEKDILNSDAIIVDDGVATGYSLIVAIESIKKLNPASITAAVPVSSREAYRKIHPLVDNFVSPIVDDTYFFAVGNYYSEWYDLEEEEIKSILKKYQDKFGRK